MIKNISALKKLIYLCVFAFTALVSVLYFADIVKIRRCLEWEPKIRIEEGIEQLLHKVDDWKDAPVWTPETIEQATRGWFHHLGVSKED